MATPTRLGRLLKMLGFTYYVGPFIDVETQPKPPGDVWTEQTWKLEAIPSPQIGLEIFFFDFVGAA